MLEIVTLIITLYIFYKIVAAFFSGLKKVFSALNYSPQEKNVNNADHKKISLDVIPYSTPAVNMPLPKPVNVSISFNTNRAGYSDFEKGEMEFESIANGYGEVLKAYKYYESASQNGIGEATNMLGVIIELYWDTYYDQHWQASDCAFFYERAANQGCIEAMANLARVHITIKPGGGDSEYHNQQAKYWFTKAAEKGFVEAMLALAVLYSYDRKKGEHAEEEYFWVCAAADSGDIRGARLKQKLESGWDATLDGAGVLKVQYFAYGTFLPFRAPSTCYTPSPTLYYHANHTADAHHIVSSYYNESLIDR